MNRSDKVLYIIILIITFFIGAKVSEVRRDPCPDPCPKSQWRQISYQYFLPGMAAGDYEFSTWIYIQDCAVVSHRNVQVRGIPKDGDNAITNFATHSGEMRPALDFEGYEYVCRREKKDEIER